MGQAAAGGLRWLECLPAQTSYVCWTGAQPLMICTLCKR